MATLPHFMVVGGSLANASPAQSLASGLAGPVWGEVPIGTIDGSNTVFTLSYLPLSPKAIWLYLNGNFQNPAVPRYSLSGQTITYAVAPKATDEHYIIYLRSGRSGKARQFGSPAGSSAGFASATGSFLDTIATGTFSATSVADGDTATVGGTVYTFRNVLNNSIPNEILANPLSQGVSLANALALAIAAGGLGRAGAGTIWSSATLFANPDVAVSVQGDTVTVQASAIPGPDNPITLASSSASLTWSAAAISSGAMVAGDTITSGSTTYTFADPLNNAVPNQIAAKPPSGHAIDALVAAINGSSGAGTLYSSATAKNTDISAAAVNGQLVVTALAGGAAANSIALSTASGGRFTWNSATLQGGSGGGGTDVVNWGTSSAYRITGDVSFGAWVKLPSNAEGSIVTQGKASICDIVFGLFVTGSSGSWDLVYEHFSGGIGGTIFDHTFTAGVANDTWVYVGFSRDTTAKTVTAYLWDGSSITTLGTYSYSTNPDIFGSGAELQIGNYLNGPGGASWEKAFTGTIEENYLWGRVLTSAEHQAAAQGNPPLNAMVMGDLMGDTPEADISSNGGSGAVTGTTLVQGHN